MAVSKCESASHDQKVGRGVAESANPEHEVLNYLTLGA